MSKINVLRGKLIDEEGRCTHWNTAKDIISIKFYCCKEYYPCYSCHDELADHDSKIWPKNQFDELAILCGSCKSELSIEQYMQSDSECPNCKAAFNPKCENHWSYYFEIE